MRVGTFDDLDEIMDIIKQALVTMKKDGNPQWGQDYPLKEHFETDILNKTLYVYQREQRILGFICINREEPEEYKAISWGKNTTADVIHRIVVAANTQGQGIGKTLLNYAETISTNNKNNYLRSDTHETNKGMNGILAKQGFLLRGQMSFFGRPGLFNCYDKIL